jgi:hypothetical protein
MMKHYLVILLAFHAIMIAGCRSMQPYGEPVGQSDEERREANAIMVNWLLDESTTNGIIAQRTLYPHHFVAETAHLNELGQRDLHVLADHYKKYPGHLSVRRAEASQDLYEARTATVTEFLSSAGIDRDQIAINDSLPGAGGMDSGLVLTILVEANSSRGGSGSTSSGSTAGVR